MTRHALRAAALAAVLAAPLPAAAQTTTLPIDELRRWALQTVLLIVRSSVDLTYEEVTVDPRSGDLVLTGLRLWPDTGSGAPCEIAVERIAFTGTPDPFRRDRASGSAAIAGLALPAACLGPEEAAPLLALGIEALVADSATLDLAYDIASSGADIALAASLAGLADVTLTASFDYLWITGLEEGVEEGEPAPEPEPVAILRSADLALEDRGLWSAVSPMLAAEIGDPAAVPALVQALLVQALTEEGTRTPTAAELAFVETAAAEVGRFVATGDRIAVSLNPATPVALADHVFASPSSVIALLNPVVSARPPLRTPLVAPDTLAAALAGGAGLDEAARLAAGRALVTGAGAPRSRTAGEALLAPLAEGWNAEAARLLAETRAAAGEDRAAYAAALRAFVEAGPTPALADTLEGRLPLAAIAGVQAETLAAWPSAYALDAEQARLLDAADPAEMRLLAEDWAQGRGRPRNLAEALYWANLAAAGGDRAAQGLLARLDARFGRREDERADWAALTAAAADRSLGTWLAGGLAARIAAR